MSAELSRALAEWADHVHRMARLSANAGQKLHADLFNGEDRHDWRCHMSVRERALIEAAEADGVWRAEP